MDCKEVKNRLGELADGEVTDIEREALLSHIAECEDCRQEYEELQLVKKEFSKLDVKLKSALADSVMERICAEAQPEKKKSPIWVRYIGTAAALIMIAGVFFYTKLAPASSYDENNSVQTESITEDSILAQEPTCSDSDIGKAESVDYTQDSDLVFSTTTPTTDMPMETPMGEATVEESTTDGNKEEPKPDSVKSEKKEHDYHYTMSDMKMTVYRYSNSIASDTALIFVDSDVDDLVPLFDEVESVTDDTVSISEPHTEVMDILLSNSITVTVTDLPTDSTHTTICTDTP